MNIVLIGAAGSGKGTEGALLARDFDLKVLASGDVLRAAIAQGTTVGVAAKPYVARGELVPDEFIVPMIMQSLEHLEGEQGVLLDGFPRTIAQAHALDEKLAALGAAISCAIYLEVPRTQLFNRLSDRYICRAHGHVWNIKTHPPRISGICDYDGSELYQRPDDTPQAVARRLDSFFGETIHLVDYYREQGKMLRVDGSKSIEQVHREILDGLVALGFVPQPVTHEIEHHYAKQAKEMSTPPDG